MAQGLYIVFQNKKKICERHNLGDLFNTGCKIQGKPAWRLSRKLGRSHPLHRRYFKRRETMWFGKRDSLLVWNPVNGYQAVHNRRWYLSFIVSLWVACRFDYKATGWKLREFGVNGHPWFIGDMVGSEIRTWWPEVRKYLMSKYPGLDINEAGKFQVDLRNKVYETAVAAEIKEAAAFYSIAERANGRILEIGHSIDKKKEAEEKQSEFMEKFSGIFQQKSEEKLDEPKTT